VTAPQTLSPEANQRTSARAGSGRFNVQRRFADLVPVVAVFVVVIVAWEVVLGALGVQQFLLPRPSVIAVALFTEWGTLVDGLQYTTVEAVGGLAIGSVVAIAVAFATARWVLARETLVPVAIAASSMPIIAFAPITNNWFGTESPVSRMTIVAVMVFFPILVNTVRGLTSVDRGALELMDSYAASEGQILRQIRIPNARPYILTAFKVATTLSVIGAVIGEYFGGPRQALGIYITGEATLFRFANAWAAIVLACALGIVLYLIVAGIERLVLPWHASGGRADSTR
jgi:NitT/TauT family transport system permease protein